MELLERIHAFLRHQYANCSNFVSLEREVCDSCLEMQHVCHRYFSIQDKGYSFFEDDIYAKYLFELLNEKYYVLSSSFDYPYVFNKYFCTDCYKPIFLRFDYEEESSSKNSYYVEFGQKGEFDADIISYHLLDMLSWSFDQLTDNRNIFVYGFIDHDSQQSSYVIENFSFHKENVSLLPFNKTNSFKRYSLCRFVINELDISFNFKSKGMRGFIPSPIFSFSKDDIKDISYFDFYSNSWSTDLNKTLKNNMKFSKREPDYQFNTNELTNDENLYNFIFNLHEEKRKNPRGN